MNVPAALHDYAKVVCVTARILLIKIIPKANVQYELTYCTGKTGDNNSCYRTRDNSRAYPLYYKGEQINTPVTRERRTDYFTRYVTKDNRRFYLIRCERKLIIVFIIIIRFSTIF
jgi:hypothetical protein